MKFKNRYKEGDFLSSIFTQEKRYGSYRMILNLKQFNKHIEYEHFKMESLQSVILYVANSCRPSKVSQILMARALLCI